MSTIYLFGDSITYGAWDIERGGWATRLRAHLDDLQEKDDSLYYLCYNMGIPGDDTDGLRARFEREFASRKLHDKNDKSIFVFAFGSNDSFYSPKAGKFAVSKEKFVENLEVVIASARKLSKSILILTAIPCDEKLCAERYAGKDKQRLNRFISEYNSLVMEVGSKMSVQVVDVYSAFGREFNDLMSEDGLHPNEKGHELIFQKVKDALTPSL